MAQFPTEEKVSFQFPVGLRVLVVDDDPTILEVIKQMCFRCQYRVMTFSDAPLALNHVREKKGCIDVILIEVHMPNMNGYEFLQHVTQETNVPVIMMSLDGAGSAVMKAITHGACDYWIKPLHENQFKIMWKHVARKFWSENKLPRNDDSEFASFAVDATVRDQKKSSSNSKEFDVDEPDDCYAPPTKKPRVIWSAELHQQFVKAVMQIGLANAQPKRILEVMKNPGLTREHVASHLQKYRLQLNRSSGVTLQQNEMPLPNTIEPRDCVGASGRHDSIAFGDTSHVTYETLAALNPEVTSNLMPNEDQWPNHSHAELQGVAYGHPMAKCPSNIVNAKNFAKSNMTVDDPSIYGVCPPSNTVRANNSTVENNNVVMDTLIAASKAAVSDASSNSFHRVLAILHDLEDCIEGGS